MISGQSGESFLPPSFQPTIENRNRYCGLTNPVKPQVHGRFHTSDERYFDGSREIIPLTQRRGHRTYVMMHPYVREPKLTFTVGLYPKPKHYADQESPIGEVIGSHHEGFREAQVGNAQAW